MRRFRNSSAEMSMQMLDLGGMSGHRSPGQIFVTEHDDQALESFTFEMLEAEQDERVSVIVIWVSSYGGDAHNALAMVDIMRSVSKPVFTVAFGKAMSAGSLLASSAQKGHRFVTANTFIMVHEASAGALGKTQDVLQQARDLEKVNKRLMKTMADNTGKTTKEFEKIFYDNRNTDLVLDAEEAVAFGLADEIGLPKVIRQPSNTAIAITGQGPKKLPKMPKIAPKGKTKK